MCSGFNCTKSTSVFFVVVLARDLLFHYYFDTLPSTWSPCPEETGWAGLSSKTGFPWRPRSGWLRSWAAGRPRRRRCGSWSGYFHIWNEKMFYILSNFSLNQWVKQRVDDRQIDLSFCVRSKCTHSCISIPYLLYCVAEIRDNKRDETIIEGITELCFFVVQGPQWSEFNKLFVLESCYCRHLLWSACNG